MEENFNIQPKPLPNATAVLVLGIISIPVCCCYGASIVLAIIALVLASSAQKLFAASPEAYTESSYKNMKAGKICAIIGLVLGAIYLIYIIYLFTHPELKNELLDRLHEMRNSGRF